MRNGGLEFPGQTRPGAAHRPGSGMRLRHVAVSPGITQRSAHGIVTDPDRGRQVMQQEDGRRNRNQTLPSSPTPARSWRLAGSQPDRCEHHPRTRGRTGGAARAVPEVLVIEDDYLSALSRHPLRPDSAEGRPGSATPNRPYPPRAHHHQSRRHRHQRPQLPPALSPAENPNCPRPRPEAGSASRPGLPSRHRAAAPT